MKRNYKAVEFKNFGRDSEFFKNQEYNDWSRYTEEELEMDRKLEGYFKYRDRAWDNIDYLETAFKILNKGKHLSLLIRQDFINLIAEILENNGWTVYLPKKVQNQGITILTEKKFNIIGYTRCIYMIRKKSPDRKIGIDVVKELKHLINDVGACKGAIATTTALTKGALKIIDQNSNSMFHLDNEIITEKLQNFQSNIRM